MSALFGFTGTPSPSLLALMGKKLAHRGDCIKQIRTDYGTVAVCGHSHEKQLEDGYATAQEQQLSLVISGICYDATGKPIQAKELLRRRLNNADYFTKGLQGDFVLALFSPEFLELYRDGAGARTLYYAHQLNRCFFASEPKGFIYLPGFSRELRPGAVAQYLSFSFIPGKNTFLEGIHELPPGSKLSIRNHRFGDPKRYFTFEHLAEGQPERSTEEWVERFREQFALAVRKRIPENQKEIGLYLSGGLDSSVVTAELAQQFSGKIKTYAIHFGRNYPNELEFAKSVAVRYGTDHQEIEVSPKGFIPRMREMIWHLDDPIGDPITMPNFALSSIASKEVPYVFNGEGGDPLFGGPKNFPLLLQHWYGGVERPDFFREHAYLQSYRRAYEEVDTLLSPDFLSRMNKQEQLFDVLTPFFETNQPNGFLNKLMAINIRLKGAHLILPKVERMTGASGITPLAPLFDEELIRLSFEMPPTLKLKHGIEKIILKEAYRDLLPEPVINRPKSGMRVPVHYWFKGEIRRYCKSILSARNIRNAGIFNYDRVKQLIDYDIEESRGRYGLRLWMIMTFELWRRQVIDNEPL